MRATPILAVLTLLAAIPLARAQPVPSGFDSVGADRQAIEALLHSYAEAVSTKNQALFESLLLDKDIPFSGIRDVGRNGRTANYESFRRGVFAGPPFTQSFRNVRIEQDGGLATVELVFTQPGSGRERLGVEDDAAAQAGRAVADRQRVLHRARSAEGGLKTDIGPG